MKTLVLGSGSWGTALATILANNPKNEVSLWSRNINTTESLQSTGINLRYHPDIILPKKLNYTSQINISDYEMLVYACPSYHLKDIVEKIDLQHHSNILFTTTAKGIHTKSLSTQSERLQDIMGAQWIENNYAVLSGPSFAYDVVRQKPTAVTLASKNSLNAKRIQTAFHCQTFHVYNSDDVIGVEIAGALKNVIAIAAGVSDGLNLGPSARSALITRGLAEITQLGVAKGAKASTFSGLAGLGDLLLTATSDLSRNRRVGLYLSEGLSLRQVIKKLGQIAEGIRTTESAFKLLKQLNVNSVIIEQIYQALYHKKELQSALDCILNQTPGEE